MCNVSNLTSRWHHFCSVKSSQLSTIYITHGSYAFIASEHFDFSITTCLGGCKSVPMQCWVLFYPSPEILNKVP